MPFTQEEIMQAYANMAAKGLLYRGQPLNPHSHDFIATAQQINHNHQMSAAQQANILAWANQCIGVPQGTIFTSVDQASPDRDMRWRLFKQPATIYVYCEAGCLEYEVRSQGHFDVLLEQLRSDHDGDIIDTFEAEATITKEALRDDE